MMSPRNQPGHQPGNITAPVIKHADPIELADLDHAALGENPTAMQRLRDRLARRDALPDLLRVLGATIIVAATGLFLFQQWDGGSDLDRYLLLVAYTLTLTGLGFITSRLLHEPKSARLFIGLGLVAISTTVTVLAALIYAQFGAVDPDSYPSGLLWQGVPGATLWGTGAISLMLMAVQARLGFTVLARPAAGPLTLLFASNAALLLIPHRGTLIVVALGIAAAALSLQRLNRLTARHLALRAPAGVAARLLVLLPLGILIGRSGYLYAADAIAAASLGLVAYLGTRQITALGTVPDGWRRTLSILALGPALFTAGALTVALFNTVKLPEAFGPITAVLILTGFVVDQHRRADPARNPFPAIGIVAILSVALIEMALWPGLASGLFATATALLAAFVARRIGANTSFRIALFVAATALLHLGLTAYEHLHLGNAFTLAATGIALLLGAAMIERHGHRVMSWLRASPPGV